MSYVDYVDRNRSRMLDELSELLAIPSISTSREHTDDCRTAANWIADHLRTLGCPRVELLEGKPEEKPIVWAESPRMPGRPTILIYGHYDVQPPDPLDEWVTSPFEPTVRDGNLYARGSADDKGQVYCLLKAFETLNANGGLGVNLHFIIEGEEEFGSDHIFDLLEREPERGHADAILVCDTAYYARGWPAVYTSLRGICYGEITVRTLKTDLHSGAYGGTAPNAHESLVRLLADLKGANGRIRIDGLYDDVERPSRAEVASWRELPFNEQTFMRKEVGAKALTGMQQRSVHERLWALPTFEIHGIMGGFTGEGAKTVIPAQATAKVSLRLVPNQREKRVQRQLKATVKKLAPPWADVSVRFIHGADPVRVDASAPVFALLGQAFKEVVRRPPVQIRQGGSIPIVGPLAKGGAPVLLTGIGLPDDRLHAPNEKLTVQQLWDGIAVFARFFELMGGGNSEQ